MGLLDGVQSLQGAPPPPATSRSDPLAQLSDGAKSVFGDFGNSLSGALGGSVDNIGGGVKSGVNSFRRLIGDESVPDVEAGGPQQQTLSDEMGSFFNLTMFQRLAMFAMCFVTGIMMIVISFSFLPIIVLAPHKFAASFTMGNVLAIVSTWILVGPRAQLQTMFHPARALAAGVYVGALVFALFAAFFGGKLRYILVLVALVAEVTSCKYAALVICHAGAQGSCSETPRALTRRLQLIYLVFGRCDTLKLMRSGVVRTELYPIWQEYDYPGVRSGKLVMTPGLNLVNVQLTNYLKAAHIHILLKGQSQEEL